MKLNKLLVLAPISLAMLSTSCSQSIRYDSSKYHLELPWNDKSNSYRILQLTDLHISNVADKDLHFKFIEETLNLANKDYDEDHKVDLIVVTGDLLTFAEKRDATKLFNFMDSLGVPWTVTFGNHDEQCYFSIDWLTSQLNDLNKKRVSSNTSHCVFLDLQDDDVFGNANFVIDLKSAEKNKIMEQLYLFDSNRYNYGEYFGYDYIHYDQIDWYERQMIYNQSEGNAPSLAFFHIPFEEFEENYQNALKGEGNCTFIKDEDGNVLNAHNSGGTGAPKFNTGLYDKVKEYSFTNGIFVGHNHTSNYAVKEATPHVGERPDSLSLCFGVKSTTNVYCDKELLGGQVITIHSENAEKGFKQGDFTIKRFLHKYEDLK